MILAPVALPALLAGVVAVTPLSPGDLPAELQPVVRELQRFGFRVRLEPPPVPGSYGLFQAGTRTLWVAPIAFELGIGPQTFLHEAVHAAQSCPSGTLTPIGWRITLSPVVDREISGILTTQYHHGNRLLEQEAFGMQGLDEAPSRLVEALRQRCR
jgi:hypothetical protein